jgi:hypothetical protein
LISQTGFLTDPHTFSFWLWISVPFRFVQRESLPKLIVFPYPDIFERHEKNIQIDAVKAEYKFQAGWKREADGRANVLLLRQLNADFIFLRIKVQGNCDPLSFDQFAFVYGYLSDEMVWIENASSQYAEWYAACIRRIAVVETGAKSAWELAERYKNQGIVKGFILYGRNDNSVNVATVYAGLKSGILVEESLLNEALECGFSLLLDARQTDLQTCFAEEKDRLNNRLIVVVSPSDPNNRDMAIAHKSMVYYGVDDFYRSVLEWMQPLSPVMKSPPSTPQAFPAILRRRWASTNVTESKANTFWH